MKLALYWSVLIAGFAAISYFYQPSIELAIISTLLLTLLGGVVAWSAHRLAFGGKVLLKTLIVALVAGFMYSQAMDIAYSITSAPAGLRLEPPIEFTAVAAILVAIGTLSRLLFLRPKQNKKTYREQSERSPE